MTACTGVLSYIHLCMLSYIHLFILSYTHLFIQVQCFCQPLWKLNSDLRISVTEFILSG